MTTRKTLGQIAEEAYHLWLDSGGLGDEFYAVAVAVEAEVLARQAAAKPEAYDMEAAVNRIYQASSRFAYHEFKATILAEFQNAAKSASGNCDSLKAELAALSDLFERVKNEARIHAQEARTAKATIAEIYQLCTGATGEPGDWQGANPVRQKLAELDAPGAQPAQPMPPSECKTEDEKTAYAFGWLKSA